MDKERVRKHSSQSLAIFALRKSEHPMFAGKKYLMEAELWRALAFEAPQDIIEEMLKIDPSLVSSECENFCTTALRVVCLNGTSIELINDVLLGNLKAAILKELLDCDERNVLHDAVDFACRSTEKQKISIALFSLYIVFVKFLLN